MTVRISTLPSGLRVATDSYDTPLAAVQVSVEVGTRHDATRTGGLAHFLEHMAFKGTTTRSAQQISHAIEDRGGWINAGTGKDVTAYYAGMLAEDAITALDVLADIVADPILNEEDFETERGVILQEIADQEDDPMSWLGDRMMSVAFTGGLSQPGLGSRKTVSKITVTDLRRLIRAYHVPGSVIVAAAGGVDHDEITRAAERFLSGLRFLRPSRRHDAVPSVYTGGSFKKRKDSTEQVHLIVAFPSFPLGDPMLYADCVLQKIIGGCSTSRLWQAIREDRGLCYDVHSSAQAWREAGLVGVKLSTGAETIEQAVTALCDELRRVRDNGISDAELARGKKLLRAEIVMENESAGSRAGSAAHHLAVHGKAYYLAEELERFEAVDQAQIGRAIERAWSAPPTVAVIGPARACEIDIEGMLRG